MTTILIAAETVLLILIAVIVVALLRSHAEILRRLGPAEEAVPGVDGGGEHPGGRYGGAAAPGPGGERFDAAIASPPQRPQAVRASDLSGRDLAGDAVQIGVGPGGPPTLIAFLSSGCLVCESFWSAFRAGPPPIPGGARLIIATKDPSHESPSRLRELAPAHLPVLMSSAAWEDYKVPTSPYFVYVDGPSGEIFGEGAASGWSQVESLLRDALEDDAVNPTGPAPGAGASAPGDGTAPRLGAVLAGQTGRARADRIDEDLARAGVGPGHPSLYPGAGER